MQLVDVCVCLSLSLSNAQMNRHIHQSHTQLQDAGGQAEKRLVGTGNFSLLQVPGAMRSFVSENAQVQVQVVCYLPAE